MKTLAVIVVAAGVLFVLMCAMQTPQPSSAAKLARHITPVPTRSLSYVDLARQDAQDAGIDPGLFVRQINQESGFNPQAVSPAGALGIAQFMPATAAGLDLDPHDPVQALKVAAGLMGRYVHQYGSIAKALACYNAGPGALARALIHGSAWQNYLPLETRNYINAILGNGGTG